jgi:hypothetical protein
MARIPIHELSGPGPDGEREALVGGYAASGPGPPIWKSICGICVICG